MRKLRIQGRAAAEPKVIAATGWDTFDLTAAIVAPDQAVAGEGPAAAAQMWAAFSL